ncbi:MAG TPA: polyprenyl synthetase family protein [Bacteroidales bacterium]|jgi:geranylgeranyl diphosphate synthase type II|nr:polyprenyl synthetase family protein [Bacteroidales bacterium]
MQSVAPFQEIINTEIHRRLALPQFQEPKGLYAPCEYILKNGGKRVRASLVLMAAKMFCHDYHKALPVALAFETFHNFTLIHDDIMDNADVRRGQPTVHVKWNTNTAILSGDAVMIMAYSFFEDAKDFVPSLFSLLNKTALEVCEGQQYDIDLELADLHEPWVTEDVYLTMIKLKTSVLIAACLKAGAIIGGANSYDAELLYQFGINVGIAFQLQDDLLDTYGNYETFGKKIGGDIAVNKKTYLVIKTLELLDSKSKQEFCSLYSSSYSYQDKYEKVLSIFDSLNIKQITQQKVDSYFKQAQECLELLHIDTALKTNLYEFMNDLQNRAY